MFEPNDVAGRIGDVSGRVGDVSGRIGDVSGRVGDVSGRIGDVSGRTLAEVQSIMLQDRESERIRCLESKVNRLENEILGIAQWLDARLRILEANIPENLGRTLNLIDQRVTTLDRKSASFQESVNRFDERLKKLEPHS